jgi:isopenicillin N synthase-like dioxygenase
MFDHLDRPHLLAPTSSDLRKYGQKDTILAGFHSDLNFLTIHGRSRYPGLNIWARNTGQRIGVQIPPGYNLLVQAGKQLEHITGGLIKAGFHEVVVNEQTLAVSDSNSLWYYLLVHSSRGLDQAMERRKVEFPDRPLIRISSTFFWHLSSDYDLVPIAALKDKARILRSQNLEAGLFEGDEVDYEPMKVGHQVRK